MTARNNYLVTTYAITEDEYGLILESQGGGCFICGRKGITRALAVDHDHKTQVVRGILCPRHNSGLQKFQDNPEFLKRAAEYLLNPPAFAVVGERLAPVKPRRRRRRRKRG